MAATHVRYGYRRLTVLLRREGWQVNAKRIYRLYREEELIVRTKQRRKMARRQRVATQMAVRANQCWSMDFVSDKLADGRSFRILAVADQFTRECVGLEADRIDDGDESGSGTGKGDERGTLPESITVDNGSEFCSRALLGFFRKYRGKGETAIDISSFFKRRRPRYGVRFISSWLWPAVPTRL